MNESISIIESYQQELNKPDVVGAWLRRKITYWDNDKKKWIATQVYANPNNELFFKDIEGEDSYNLCKWKWIKIIMPLVKT